jgi:uncharacterized protein (TIGR03067 family)
MRWQVLVAAALPFVLWFTAGVSAQPGDLPKERKPLQGTWQAVRLEADGEVGPQEVTKKVRWIFTSDQYTGVSPETQFKGKFTLDPGKNPKEIDLAPAGGKGKMLGIYSVEGDKLTLCIGETRPTEFTAKDGSKRRLYVLKRVKE